MKFLPLCVLSLCLVEVAHAQDREFETTRLDEGVYQFRYKTHNGFFVVTADGVVAFDPISTEAARLYAAEIKRLAPGVPLAAIVYSHDHADHATGANVLRTAFSARVPVIAHDNAVSRIAETADEDLPTPDITFRDQLTLYFGGRRLELHYLGRSHSDNMIVALLPKERLAFAVDFVTNDGVGYRELPDYYFPEFFEALAKLQELDFDSIAFGHGPPGDRAAIARQVNYYSELRAAVREAVDKGWSEDEAAQRIRLSAYAGWRQYDSWFPLNVRALYRWMTGR
ncbi:MAG: MBL fold metallo-hydrolase [Gemmatimonadales bacterium]